MEVSDVLTLSDEELRTQLKAFNMDVGPIMDTTRKLYQRKLIRFLTGDEADFECGSGLDSASSESIDGTTNEGTPKLRERRTLFAENISPTQQQKSYSPKSTFNARQLNSPFPAANAQFKKAECNSSMTDHCMKFACFGIVVMIIVYFIMNQNPGNGVQVRS